MMKLLKSQIQQLNKLVDKNNLVQSIIEKINKANARAILVGGAVRDLLLGIPVKDLDIEVYGLRPEELEHILKNFGPVSLVGKSFGVFRLHGLDIDWSLPRQDSKGRKPKVEVNPFMTFEEAFKRRDLTINSMGIDLITKELIDPYTGYKDLKNKILRATDKRFFIQDPLRFYRVMQFIARFEMCPDKTLNNICKNMDISKISRERIEEEFKKMFLKSKRPSLGIRWLDQIGRLHEIIPEVYNTKGVKQNPQWHPEGDVFEHTMQAIDAAAVLEYEDNKDKLILCFAALLHDIGKATTTKYVKDKYISYEHEFESEKLAKAFLSKVINEIEVKKTILKLIRYHMQPGQLIRNNARDASYKRLALKLMPDTNLEMLSKLFMADRLGRNPKKNEPLKKIDPEVKKFIKKIKSLHIEERPVEPLLHGKDLLKVVNAGPEIGKILKEAYLIQINENIHDKEKLKKRVLKKYLKK